MKEPNLNIVSTDEYNELEKHLMRFKHDEMIIECDERYMFYKLFTHNGIRRLTHCGVSYEGRIYLITISK